MIDCLMDRKITIGTVYEEDTLHPHTQSGEGCEREMRYEVKIVICK